MSNDKEALNPNEFVAFKLESRRDLNHNTSLYEFAFPEAQDTLGLKVASCLLVKADMEVTDRETGVKEVKPVIRPYTPISTVGRKGTVQLLIKRYPGGLMSNHIHELKIGETLLFKGPIDKIKYSANKWSHIGMVAGGSGITPMYQVLLYALNDTSDKTKFTLLFANVTPEDILLKSELNDLANKHPDRFKIHYIIDKAPETWNGFTGYVSADMFKKADMPTSADMNAMIFVCGSPAMVNSVSGPKAVDKSQGDIGAGTILDKLGFDKEHVMKF